MNRLIKAVLLSCILAGIAVYILVSSMPGETPQEKMRVFEERSNQVVQEGSKALNEGRPGDLRSIIVPILMRPPTPEEFPAADAVSSLTPAPDRPAVGVQTPPKPPAVPAAPAASATAAPATPALEDCAATAQPPASAQPALRTHKIAPGETLSSIAQKYYGHVSYWTLLRDRNHGLDPHALRVGAVIEVPKRGTEPTNEPRTEPTTEPAQTRTHVVMAGDTLYKLARMYFGTDSAWKKIRDANPEIDPDNLLLHARIIIPQ